jgi:hypothetical protein
MAEDRSLVAEAGCALALGGRAAGALLAESHALTTALPRTLAALQSGTISWAHARTMVEQTVTLDPAAATALEAHFLDPGAPMPAKGCPIGEMPAYRFKAKARIWRERHHPESLEKRHARSVADRRVEHCPDNDAMAWISAYLPAVTAKAIWNHCTAAAHRLQGPNERRTLSQRRADEFTAALLDGNSTGTGTVRYGGDGGINIGGGEEPGDDVGADSNTAVGAGGAKTAAGGESRGSGPSWWIRPQVLVTVPVFSLIGLTEEPAMLDGHGPIPASMARDLVANGAGSFYRVLVDPRDGAPLEIGRTSYRVGTAMRNWLRMQDARCPFPGSSNHSLDNEADHILAWHHGGTTGISNLGQPCPKHHKLRHTSGWKPTPATKNEPPGWISPTGRHYRSESPDWEPPHWPEMSEPQGGPEIPDPQSWPNFDRVYPEPPVEEPLNGNLADSDDIPVDDDVWEEFYALQVVLPKDPFKDCEQSALVGAETNAGTEQ